MLHHPAQFFHNLERKIGHEIFVKTENTEYLSNQLTFAHFHQKFIFPIKNRACEQIFIFWISKMFQISGSPTVKDQKLQMNGFKTDLYFCYNQFFYGLTISDTDLMIGYLPFPQRF